MKQRKVSIILAVVLCIVLSTFLLAGCGKQSPNFRELYEGLSDKYGWTLGGDGSYLSADTNVFDLDDYSSSAILYEIKDMNRKLGLPESLWNDMANTTWSMGRQEESFEDIGIKVTWTYHPDKGMEVSYKLINH